MSLNFSKLGARQRESDIARLMTMALNRPELLSLAAGFTDNATLPLEEVSGIAFELGKENDKKVLQYGANQGSRQLRELLTGRFAEQDGSDGYAPDRAFIANGSQQALYLAVQTLCDPGDIVLVEQPTYFVFLEMLRGLGVKAVSMPMLEDGDVDVANLQIQLDDFEKRGEIDKVKAMYLVSYYANPSGHSVSSNTKTELVSLLEKYDGRIALFEDAAYRELYYASPFEAPSCIAAAKPDSAVPVFYSTTLTKPFASGLKVGYGYCTHDDWLARMLAIKGQQDFGTSNYLQAIFVRVLGSETFDRHLLRIRQSYREKMETLHQALLPLKDLGWNWEKPQGGLYIWATAPREIETGFESHFCRECLKDGVIYVPGELCHADRQSNHTVRLSFGVLDRNSLIEAGKRFCGAAKAFCE